MTQPGIEPRSPGPLANSLLIKPIFKPRTSHGHPCLFRVTYKKLFPGFRVAMPSNIPSRSLSEKFEDCDIINRRNLFLARSRAFKINPESLKTRKNTKSLISVIDNY